MNGTLTLLDLEQFIPVMSSSELSKYEQAILGLKAALFCMNHVDRWESLLASLNADIQIRFNSSIRKSTIQ